MSFIWMIIYRTKPYWKACRKKPPPNPFSVNRLNAVLYYYISLYLLYTSCCLGIISLCICRKKEKTIASDYVLLCDVNKFLFSLFFHWCFIWYVCIRLYCVIMMIVMMNLTYNMYRELCELFFFSVRIIVSMM